MSDVGFQFTRPWIERVVRVTVMLALAWMVSSFWHPYCGFTLFLQIDAPVVGEMTPVLR